MPLYVKLLPVLLFISLSCFSQQENIMDSMKCVSYFDTLAGRQIVRFPEKDAEYKGGVERFSTYINRNFNYDKSHVDHQAFLYFTFIVEKDGSVSNVALQKPTRGVMDDVVQLGLTAFKNLPRLKPAMCNNQQVPVRLIQPLAVSPN